MTEAAEASGEADRQRALEELEVLDTPPEERFDRVTRLATRLFGVPVAMVNLIDRDRQWSKSSEGITLGDVPRRDAFCTVAIEDDGLLVVEDALVDARFADNPLVTGDPNIRFYAGQPLLARGGQRVGALCIIDRQPRSLSEPERALLRDLALWVEKELVVEEEMARAAEVQRSLLPRETPDVPGYDLAGACRPTWSVGGDLYDWYPTPHGLVLTMADVMGKGLGGAILMATVRAVLRGTAFQPDLAAAVTQAGRSLEGDLGGTDSFATLFQARLDPASATVEYVDAGHGLAAVVRAGGAVERLGTGDLPLGILPDSAWTSTTLSLQPGDALVVFSDGLLDVDGEASSPEDVEAVLAATAATVAAAETCQAAVDAILPPGPAADDDVTVVVLRRSS